MSERNGKEKIEKVFRLPASAARFRGSAAFIFIERPQNCQLHRLLYRRAQKITNSAQFFFCFVLFFFSAQLPHSDIPVICWRVVNILVRSNTCNSTAMEHLMSEMILHWLVILALNVNLQFHLQIISDSKQVICPARDKFWPDKKPVWSDGTCFSITCLHQLILWSSNKIKTLHLWAQTSSYIVFKLDLKCPVTVSGQAKILPVKIRILVDNFRCSTVICKLF